MAGLFSGETPTPKYVSLDPQTQGLLDQGVTHASRPTSDFASDTNAGVDNARTALNPVNEQSSAITGMSPGMFKAIQNNYGMHAGEAINRLKSQNDFEANLRKSNNLKQMAISALGQQQAMTNNYSALTDAYNQAEAARSQSVSALTGLASYGIGHYAAAPKGYGKAQSSQATLNPGSPQNVSGGYGDIGGPNTDPTANA